MLIMNFFRGRSLGMKCIHSCLLTVLAVTISFFGAKVLYYIENPKILLQSGIRPGGVSLFGAVFAVPIFMYLGCKAARKPYGRIMDFLTPSLLLILAVLRVGCFVSDCCGGIAVVFAGVYVEKFPTQITECVCDLLILAGLLLYERFWKNEGRLYGFFMVYYGILRFLLEFLRDTLKESLYLSHGQWFSLISVCIGGYMLQRMGKLDRKKRRRSRR